MLKRSWDEINVRLSEIEVTSIGAEMKLRQS